MTGNSLQDTYAPESICFGCGPANTQGLRIKSFVQGNEVVAGGCHSRTTRRSRGC